MTLVFASYLDVIAEETERVIEAASTGLEIAVPSCPGWSVRDLVDHLAAVYRHWSVQVELGDETSEATVEYPIRSLEPTESIEAEMTTLIQSLERRGPDAPCWNWSGEDLRTGWVARRMALEVAIHRVDAERARGRSNPIERELAVDGIEEYIDVHLRELLRQDHSANLGGRLCLICRDAPAAWTVEVERGVLRFRAERAPANTAAVASASDLFLFVWNRVGTDVLEITGDEQVATSWRDLPT